MELSLKRDMLQQYLAAQIETFFPDGHIMAGSDVDRALDLGLERLENCFKHIAFPQYCTDDGQTHFSHLHADQYATFLYYFQIHYGNYRKTKMYVIK